MNKKALMYLFLTAAVYSLYVIINKAGLNSGLEPLSFTFFTLLVAGILSFLYLVPKRKVVKKLKKDWKGVLLLGVIASGTANITFYFGQSMTTATNTGFLMTLTALSTIPFAYLLVGESFRGKWLFVFISLFGVFLLTTGGTMSVPNIGDLLIILVVVQLGFSNAWAKRYMKKAPGDVIASLRLAIASIFVAIVTFIFIGTNSFQTLFTGWYYILVNGVFMFVSTATFYKGIELSKPALACFVMLIYSVFIAILSYIFLGEVLSMIQWLGAGVILLGTVLLARKN